MDGAAKLISSELKSSEESGIKGYGKTSAKPVTSERRGSSPMDGVVFEDETVGEGGGRSLGSGRSGIDGVRGEGVKALGSGRSGMDGVRGEAEKSLSCFKVELKGGADLHQVAKSCQGPN
jgi:hypothetical protein